MTNIITLKQEPIISYAKIQEVGQEVQKRISELNLENQIATADTIQAIKTTRTDLNKEFAVFEDQRKFIKKAVETPYKEFEQKYKEFISQHYNNADEILKDKISRFENELKNEKTERIRIYFLELAQSKNIDFLAFERLNLKITLSASDKSLREQVDRFVLDVADKLDLLKSVPESNDFKAEVLFEYKKTLDMNNSLLIVQERKKAKEEELKRAEIDKEKKAKELQKQEPTTPQPEILQAPKVEEPTAEPKLYTTSFRVKGTKEQLVALKQFIISNNIQILD